VSARKTAKPAKTSRRVYFFGDGKADGSATMKELLGGKGANLAEMTRLGLPVPPGFTIATTVCTEYQAAGDRIPKSLEPEIAKALASRCRA
jgi:pyruvate,orthophosphate dikinase